MVTQQDTPVGQGLLKQDSTNLPLYICFILILNILIFKSFNTQNTLPNGIIISILQRFRKVKRFAQSHITLNDSSRMISQA